ncbi:MAG: prepilin-type N-terminal cleavage/methylation domain-containing protein [Opitutae bacterium]|nr:prepilin-type N-terminal cleavage/methylation domain-containing protein [Opitutae bacterium]
MLRADRTLPSRPGARLRRNVRGFTLVEMMIGAALSSFILAGVLSTFLFIGRSGVNVQNYSDMESQARKALETFAEDVRQASAITWNSDVSVTLVVNSANVVYQYDSTAATFSRLVSGQTRTLISGITAGTFTFKAYNVAGTELLVDTAANRTAANSSTKQLQISLECSRSNTTVVAVTNTVLSARFILRNKIVTA